MQNVGIYRIQIGPYYYLGQSQELKKRGKEHLYRLKKGNHVNPKMQNIYNKYKDYSFKVMIECDADQLDYLEQSALDIHWGYDDCMNLSKCAEAPTRGLKLSEETKRKMSEAQKGKKLSEEHKRKLIESRQDKTIHTFTHEEHGEIICAQGTLRKKYNLDRGNLSRVISGQYKQHKGWRLK